MKDLLDDLYHRHVLSGPSILSKIDSFTLFCYYLDYSPEIHQRYISPLRDDDTNESFALFEARDGTFKYHDFGTGETGDVFALVAGLYGCTYQEALAKVNSDFGLGFNGEKPKDLQIQKRIPVIKPKRKLQVTTKKTLSNRGKRYWDQYHITQSVLDLYNVREVEWLHFDDKSFMPSSLAFDYRIGNYHKIYQPYNSKYKFISSYPRTYVEGFLQLKYKSDTLIITKSLKDVMCLYILGWEAISPKSENTPISDFILNKLKSKYKYIYLLFDNDNAGKLGANRYDFPEIYMKSAKDISDVIEQEGIMSARREFIHILQTVRT
tara:strand:- start:3227 stop:4192 length:966 start_codon:yes stop_codon:yes gene_type:complete